MWKCVSGGAGRKPLEMYFCLGVDLGKKSVFAELSTLAQAPVQTLTHLFFTTTP